MTTYYVRSDADAGGDGTTTNTTGGTCAWNSIAQVNAKNFSSGDIVYFRPGDTFDDANFTLAGVSSAITGLTIQGYDFGGRTLTTNGKPWIDHDSMYTQIANSNISSLTLKDLNVSGLGILTSKSSNVNISNIDGIVIDGLYMQGDYATPIANKTGQNGVVLQDTCTGTIEIKNCEIFNLGATDGSGNLDMFSTTTDCIGLVMNGVENATVYIHDNIIHDVQADCIQLYLSLASDNSMTYIYDNDLYNAGEDNIDVKGYDNVEIYNNNFFRSAGFEGHTSANLIKAINVHQSSFQTTTHTNIKIHDNQFYDIPAPSGVTTYIINVGTSSDEPYENVQIYRNTFDNTHMCIAIFNYISDLYITNNLILNPLSRCINVNNAAAGNRYITNNTIIRGTETSGISAIYMDYSNQDVIRNNIVEWGGSGAMCLTVTTSGTAPTVDHNIWNNADDTNKVSWLGTSYGTSNWSTWEASHTGDSYADPQLLSTGRLDTGSPAFGAGVIVAGVNDIGRLDIWGNCNNDSPNIGADLGSDQNATSIDTGFAFNEASYTVRVR